MNHRDEATEIGNDQKNPESTNKGHNLPGVLGCDRGNGILDGENETFNRCLQRLRRPGLDAQPAGHQPGEYPDHTHDHPGGHHRVGDFHWPQFEDGFDE